MSDCDLCNGGLDDGREPDGLCRFALLAVPGLVSSWGKLCCLEGTGAMIAGCPVFEEGIEEIPIMLVGRPKAGFDCMKAFHSFVADMDDPEGSVGNDGG